MGAHLLLGCVLNHRPPEVPVATIGCQQAVEDEIARELA